MTRIDSTSERVEKEGLVESEGVEPSLPPCRGGVLPLYYDPRLVGGQGVEPCLGSCPEREVYRTSRGTGPAACRW